MKDFHSKIKNNPCIYNNFIMFSYFLASENRALCIKMAVIAKQLVQ